MRSVLTVAGVAAMLMGLLWIGQGLGIVRWPASSFMIDMSAWCWRGAVLAAVGVALIVYARLGRRIG